MLDPNRQRQPLISREEATASGSNVFLRVDDRIERELARYRARRESEPPPWREPIKRLRVEWARWKARR